MKTLVAIALLHLATACAHRNDDDGSLAVEPIPPASHADLADVDDQSMVHGRPPVYASASLEQLRTVIDGTMMTEPRLDRLRVATILASIADAMEALPQHNPNSVNAIREDIATLRGRPQRPAFQAEIVRRALDEAIVDLRTNEPPRVHDDVERAITSVATVVSDRPLRKQAFAVREALCAVGNAIETRGEMRQLSCVTTMQASLERPHRKHGALAETP